MSATNPPGGEASTAGERDLAELHRQLEQRVEEFETLLRVIPMGISIAHDPQCERVTNNSHMAALMGHAPERNASLNAPPEDRETAYRVFRDGVELSADDLPMHRALALGTTVMGLEFDALTPDGRRLTIVGHAAPIVDGSGAARGAVAAFLDITARKCAERELSAMLLREQAARAHAEALALDNARLYREAQEAGQVKDSFLAMVSHELRTPLSAILGWVQLLRRGGLSPEARDRALETIERNARTQSRLVEDILDVSRMVTGTFRISVEAVDFGALVAQALESVAPLARERGVVLEVTLAPGPRDLRGDPARLQQVVWNMVSNAIKFTPSGGQVEVTLGNDGDRHRLVVRDTGQGIAPEFLPHVFEPFRQADASDSRASSGLGLGMAIVRHIIECHGGEVRVTSEGLNRGATFSVWLPRQEPRATGAEASTG